MLSGNSTIIYLNNLRTSGSLYEPLDKFILEKFILEKIVNRMLSIIKLFVCLSVVVIVSDAARILAVVPTPSISHQVVFRPLTQELVRRGHDVTIITTDPVFPKGQAPENLTEIDLHDFSYKLWREIVFSSEVTSGSTNDATQQIKMFYGVMSKIFEKQMQHPEVKKIISNETQYDLLILEAWVQPAMLFTHVHKDIPVILVSSLGGFGGIYDVVGIPSRPPLLYPSALRKKLTDLTLSNRLAELYDHYVYENMFSNEDDAANRLIKKILGPETPDLKELNNNVDMLFLNIHPLWEMNRPVPPSVVYMGGIHQKAEKELPKVSVLWAFVDITKVRF